MASRLLRRSGVAVGLVCDCLGWMPDYVVQVGVGVHCEEVDVLHYEWPDCRFIGFEPHPGTFSSIRKSYPGHLIQKAISDRCGTAAFYAKKKHADGSSLFYHDLLSQDERAKVCRLDVDVTTLDTVFTKDYPVGKILLWLDCEGNELNALRGGESLLERVGFVNVEVTHRPPSSGWCSHEDIQDYLEAHGFYAQWIHTQRISSGQCDVVYVRKSLFKPEYCCLPWEVKRYHATASVC